MFVKVSHLRIYDEEDFRVMPLGEKKARLDQMFGGYKYDYQTCDHQELDEFVKMLNRDDIHIKLDAVESFYYAKRFKTWAIVFNKKEYLIDKTDKEKFLEWKTNQIK